MRALQDALLRFALGWPHPGVMGSIRILTSSSGGLSGVYLTLGVAQVRLL